MDYSGRMAHWILRLILGIFLWHEYDKSMAVVAVEDIKLNYNDESYSDYNASSSVDTSFDDPNYDFSRYGGSSSSSDYESDDDEPSFNSLHTVPRRFRI